MSHIAVYDVGGDTIGSVGTKLRNLFIFPLNSAALHITKAFSLLSKVVDMNLDLRDD